MKRIIIQPDERLQPYIASFWAFESSFGLPAGDSRIIIPNGTARITIPYKNSFSIIGDDKPVETKEHHILLAGIWDIPATISSPAKPSGTIGIDLTPKGLYHFFKLKMQEMKNRISNFEDVFGAWGARIQYALGDIENPQQKIVFIQKALISLLDRNTKDYSVIDYAVDSIMQSQGIINIKGLEKQTGYSKRYLDMLFKERVGVSPKTLARIMRFHRFYRLWAQTKSRTFFKEDLYSSYYDQSHFIKEFKRFTGYSPQKYNELTTEFSRMFCAH